MFRAVGFLGFRFWWFGFRSLSLGAYFGVYRV